MHNLAEDCSIIIKPADKGLNIVIWDREDLSEDYGQLSDHTTYTDIKKFNQKHMSDLTEKSNRIFKGLCTENLSQKKIGNIFDLTLGMLV